MSKYIETKNISLDLTELTPWHPRKNLQQADIEAIGENIAEKGQMQSIRVVRREGKYVIAFGGRRVTGSKLKGLKEIRAEIWEMTDTELINDQARELVHTASLDGSPDIDAFLSFTFHHNVEQRINDLSNFDRSSLCPKCYDCNKYPGGKGKKGCPAFLSQTEFAERIIGNMKQSSISMAISRERLRNQIPEISELALPSPSATLPVIESLLRDQVVNKEEAIALASKAADGQLGTSTSEHKLKHGGSGPVKTLIRVGDYLRGKERGEIPKQIREKLIYNPNYGPAETEYDMLPKRKVAKTDEKLLEDIIEMAERLADKLDKVKRDGKLEEVDLKEFAVTLRLLADYFEGFAKLAERRLT